ncbi:MAG: hypothetical protein N4A47_00975 [Clostridia bacterium]|jgi:hypothetical protein|nr:hypothetical protein [Clostridia bacterium]
MRKIVALMLAFVVMFAGCGKAKTADELMKNAYSDFLKETSYETNFEMTLDVDDEKLSEEMKQAVAMLKGSKVTADMRAIVKDGVNLDLNAEAMFMGQAYEMFMYADNEEFMFKLDNEMLKLESPEIIGKYIVMNLPAIKEEMEAMGESTAKLDVKAEYERQMKLVKENYEGVIDSVKDRLVLTEKEDGYDVTLDVTIEDVKAYLVGAIELALNEDEATLDSLKTIYTDENLTDEEIKALYMEELNTQLDGGIALMGMMGINIDEMKMTYMLDKDGKFKGSNFSLVVSIKAEETATIRLNAKSEYKNVGNVTEIVKPEVTEENSIDFMEMMKAQMLAPTPAVEVIGETE